MSPEQLALLQEIQALEFTCVDLNLYLDTHPTDPNALADYNTTVQQLAVRKAEYAQAYGPFMGFGQETVCPSWTWICEPWPWEIEY